MMLIRAIFIGWVCITLMGCTNSNVLRVFDNLHLTAGSVKEIQAANPVEIETDDFVYALPEEYFFDDSVRSTAKLLRDSGTAGLLIIHKGKIVYEDYGYGKNQDSLFHAWSVSKSFTSALVGIAVEEGYININDLVVDYVPSLQATGYADSTIEDLLEMASGVRFNETYWIGTDISRLQGAIGKDLSEEIHKYVDSDHPTGTFNEYKSIDTVVLGMVLTNATGESVSSYLQSRLWEPAGMTRDARWLADQNGLEAAYCCLQATLRDQAKLGLIYLNNGFYNGRQIVPQAWVEASLDTSKPHLQPGENPQSDDTWGYGYQWWIPDESNDFAAVGVFNQFVYVNPEKELIIAKASGAFSYLYNFREDEHIAFFRTISNDFSE